MYAFFIENSNNKNQNKTKTETTRKTTTTKTDPIWSNSQQQQTACQVFLQLYTTRNDRWDLV